MTLKPDFALLLARCGLTNVDAAAWLNVSVGTVDNWTAGRRKASATAVMALCALYREIERYSDLITAPPPPDLPAGALGAARGIALARGLLDLGEGR